MLLLGTEYASSPVHFLQLQWVSRLLFFLRLREAHQQCFEGLTYPLFSVIYGKDVEKQRFIFLVTHLDYRKDDKCVHSAQFRPITRSKADNAGHNLWQCSAFIAPGIGSICVFLRGDESMDDSWRKPSSGFQFQLLN
jgi:hypothetical protein